MHGRENPQEEGVYAANHIVTRDKGFKVYLKYIEREEHFVVAPFKDLLLKRGLLKLERPPPPPTPAPAPQPQLEKDSELPPGPYDIVKFHRKRQVHPFTANRRLVLNYLSRRDPREATELILRFGEINSYFHPLKEPFQQINAEPTSYGKCRKLLDILVRRPVEESVQFLTDTFKNFPPPSESKVPLISILEQLKECGEGVWRAL